MRLHELAKKYGYNQQDLLAAVKERFDVKDALTTVDGEVEGWVADKARERWVPPPSKTKAAKKISVKPPVKRTPQKPASPERPEAAAEASGPEERADVAPAVAVVPALDAEKAEPVRESRSEPNEAKAIDAVPESHVVDAPGGIPAEPEPSAAPESGDGKPSDVKPQPITRRLPKKVVTGGAKVGMLTSDQINNIKNKARGPGKSAPPGRGAGMAPPPRGARPPGGEGEGARPRPPGGRKDSDAPRKRPGPRAEQDVSEDVVKKVLRKTRITKVRGRDDERDSADKKPKTPGKRRSSDSEDWGLDDDLGAGGYTPPVDAPSDASDASDPSIAAEPPEAIPQDMFTTDAGGGRSVKHKRADFKSRQAQRELPASFAELDGDFARSISGGGGRRRSGRGTQRRSRMTGRRSRTRRIQAPVPRAPDQEAVVRLGMTLRDLSIAFGVKLQGMLSFLLARGGNVVQVNDIMSEEDIRILSEKFVIPIRWEAEDDLEEDLAEEERQQSELYDSGETVERPPVVTFMGHVDHGKTSLLDAIRNTRVAAGEHGGITQHIGAYSVERNGKRVTFLDTPGHEAFSAMRARGANITDIAVLVVAADDGVMPQTEEAASHAKNAGVPVIIAINKCDMPSANPDRVRQELANRLNLLPEEWGGQVGMINVSAHTKQGIDNLVERILLEAEVLELRSNPSRPATGYVVEARMSEGQGVVATLLVGDGTLHVGDVILCSNSYGKIRFMFDEFGRSIAAAGPGAPVRVSGLSAVPEAGDRFFILSDLLKARAIAGQREREAKAAALARRQHVTLENLTSHLAGSGKRELGVIVKADVVGSLEVIEKTLLDMSTPEVGINIIHSAVGGVNHADVILADASDAIVLGFHVGVESQARSAAASLGVQIRAYHVIYRIMEDMKAALEGLLPPEEREVVQGHVDIREVFRSSKVGAIAGCYVVDGHVQRSYRIRLFRNQVMVYEGAIQSLRRVKDDVREVKAGFECGIKIAGYDAIEKGDTMEAFSIEEIARKL